MNYHDLKVAHIFFAFVTIALSSALFSGAEGKSKKIIYGLSTLLLIGTGFAIMGRFGIKHSPPYPTWINIKIGLWLVLTIATPIVVKRYPQKATRLFWPWVVLALFATMMAVYKPM
ncbi:MAG: hypothetical protein CME64_00300 [Halobacteriovoraceae bacterium]|nr:hypothetical protein [Halobacteriovoraceae bacterium]|tara:strand:+ start:76038 stop:76385 length:348 start_codon:yes stop_codon:yes gene_type:complete